MKSLITGGLGFLRDLVFPIKCINCYQEGEFLCDDCRDLLKPRTDLCCPVCKSDLGSVSVCQSCRGQSFLDGLYILADYQNDLVKKIIRLIKYGFISDLSSELSVLARLYFEKNNNWQNDFVFLPVPLSRKRFLFRGFNQSDLIARVFAGELGGRVENSLLIRHRNTKPQAKLNAEKRKANMRGVFKIADDFDQSLRDKKILLVDDVYTTGATMGECARVLRENGFEQVWGIAIARG